MAEEYWGSTTNETMHDLESGTKSIASALLPPGLPKKQSEEDSVGVGTLMPGPGEKGV